MKNLKIIRESKNYSQLKVSMDLGISQELISKYETSKSTPSFDILIKMSNYFKCSIDYLCDLTDDPTPIDVLSKNSTLSIEERKLLSEYNSLSKDDKLRLEGIIVALKGIH